MTVVVSCSSDKKTVEKDANKFGLIKPDTLTICSDIPFTPFEFYDGSDVVGVDAELIINIADQLNLHTEFVDVDFGDIFTSLEDQKCDIIASAISMTDEREKLYQFSDSYYEISQSILTINSNSSVFTDLDKLQGKVVGVQSGSTGEEFAQENSSENKYSVTSYESSDSLILALKKNEIDAVIQDYPINAYESASAGTTKVTKVFDGKEKYGFVVTKDKSALITAVNKALKKATDNGNYDEILTKYLGNQGSL